MTVNGGTAGCEDSDSEHGGALVVENELVIAWSLSEVIRGCGLERVVVAPSAHSAAEAARASRFALIVCDLQLEDHSSDGLSVLREIDPDQSTPTIVYSGHLDDPRIAAAVAAARPDAVMLSKPASDAQIAEAIRALLAQAGPPAGE